MALAGAHGPTADQTWTAIAEAVTGMLDAPIANLGVRGIGTAAKRVRDWPKTVPADLLSRSVFRGSHLHRTPQAAPAAGSSATCTVVS